MDQNLHPYPDEQDDYDRQLAFLRTGSTVQFQIPHFVLGGTPSLARGGGAEVLPGMYGQGPHAWSEYDKYWYDQCQPGLSKEYTDMPAEQPSLHAPRPFEFDSPPMDTLPFTPPSDALHDRRALLHHQRTLANTPSTSLSQPALPAHPFLALPTPNPQDPTAPLPPLPPTGLPLYSASGFDMLRILAKVATRPNPKIMLGPVDMTCSFVVADLRRVDAPIVYASPTFTRLTGYTAPEVLGRNCRFLQHPTGQLARGAPRRHTAPSAVHHMRKSLLQEKECQASLINYRKDGTAFVNLVTCIPISAPEDYSAHPYAAGARENDADADEEITHCVGFQVDLAEQPNAILEKLRDGSYIVNYSQTIAPGHEPGNAPGYAAADAYGYGGVGSVAPGVLGAPGVRRGKGVSADMMDVVRKVRGVSAAGGAAGGAAGVTPVVGTGASHAEVGAKGARDGDRAELHAMLLENMDDFIHVVSLKGTLLYVAPAVTRVLGYDAAELVGKSIARLCHPADVVPLMRKLKDASSTLAHNVPPHPAHIPGHPHPIILLPPSPPPPKSISLLFRAAHKTRGGYVWLEARGRLHVEPGKGRKAVVLVGRRVGVGKLGWGVVDSVGEGLSDGSVGMDQRPECWGLVSPSGIILSASPGGAQMLGYTHAPCGSARLTGPALDAARAVLVGHSLSALLLPSDVRRVGEVLAGAACASTRMERDEVRRVRCYMQRWGAVRAQNARTVHAEGLESANGDRQRQGGGDVQRDGTGDVSVSGMGAGAGVAAPRPIPVELRFIAQPRDREQGVMSEEEARRAPAVPGKVVFQMLLLGEGVAGADAGVDTHGGQTSLRSSPSAALPSRSTDSPQHTHTRSRTPRPSRGNIFAELDTLSLPPSPASFPSSPASPFSASASASASTSLPSPTTAPSETSWQYSLTRLRFENERMRGEVARLERMQSVPGTRGRGAHLRGRAGAERLTTTTTTTTTRRSYGRRRGGDAGASSRGTAAGRAEESGFGAGGGRDAHAQIMSCMPNIPHKRTREEMMEELPEVTRPP